MRYKKTPNTYIAAGDRKLDHSNYDDFFQYYAEQSLTKDTFARFLNVRTKILSLLGPQRAQQCLQVADIGCGAGTQSFLWAELGHQVVGIDISERLIQLARERGSKDTGKVGFYVGTATELPWPDRSMDVCLVPELLEHVADWKRCLNELVRVLKPGGVLYLSTTNNLCPKQSEFNLPLYAWYPGFLKRHYEKLAMTTHPELANYATYPAVNWFNFYSLRAALGSDQFDCLDRFDSRLHLPDSNKKAILLKILHSMPVLKFLARMCTPYTEMMAIKRP
ncbi:MAG: class I SAM-dependent methyltransferase [Candidatus Competibacteraceae bacterium]